MNKKRDVLWQVEVVPTIFYLLSVDNLPIMKMSALKIFVIELESSLCLKYKELILCYQLAFKRVISFVLSKYSFSKDFLIEIHIVF